MTSKVDREPVTNPIKEAATRIKTTINDLVTNDLGDAFPKNYDYGFGDYNLVFAITPESESMARNWAYMVILNKDGEFESGQVHLRMENWYSGWEFRKAQLKPADDLEIVRFAPCLVLLLFSQLENELNAQDNPENISKVLNVLGRGKDTFTQIFTTSKIALIEMGEDEPKMVIGQNANKFDDVLSTGEYPGKEYARELAAYSLYQRREQILQEIRSLAENMRVAPVEEWFDQLIVHLKLKELFPVTVEGYKEKNLYIANKSYLHDGVARQLAIADDGDVKEVRLSSYGGGHNDIYNDRKCVEHLLKYAPSLAAGLVNAAIANVFPKLK